VRRGVRDPIDPRVGTSVLDNGLRVVTVQLPHLHTCTLAFCVKAGPRFETAAENGLSHLVEHMLFRGTARHRGPRALGAAVDGLGAALDGATDRDLGVLRMSLPPERLRAGMELLGDIVLRPRFADIRAERALVLQEMSEDYEGGVETNPEDLACGAQFAGHPLGQRILGPRRNVERFTVGDVKRHHARFHAARNAVLCVAGPVEHAAVASAAERHFGSMRPGVEIGSAPVPPAAGGPRVCPAASSGSSVALALTLRGITRAEPQAYAAFEVLLRLLDGGGMSGRVYERLCIRDGLAYTVDAEILDHGDVTLLQFTSEVATANLVRVVADTLDVLTALARRPVPDPELLRVREGYRSSLLAQLDDTAAMAEWFGSAALFRAPSSRSARLALVSRVSPRDVMHVARRVADAAGLALAVVGPVSRPRLRALRRAVS